MRSESAKDLTAALIPSAVLALYAWFIFASFAGELNWDLTYRRPELPVAPEDVLGLGFWIPWLFVALIFVFSLLVALILVKRRVRFAIIFLGVFGLLSGVNLFLYETLLRQILEA